MLRLVLTHEEIARCLPPSGEYLVRVAAVALLPSPERPLEVELRLEVLSPPPHPVILLDRFDIRGDPRTAIPGLHRLMLLLHHAGQIVRADEPVDLQSLVGLEIRAHVLRETGPGGFPYSRIVRYTRTPRIPIDASSATATTGPSGHPSTMSFRSCNSPVASIDASPPVAPRSAEDRGLLSRDFPLDQT